jgi:alpha-L-rhamnosidase
LRTFKKHTFAFNLYLQKILGLEPVSYGWATFDVRPMVCDITWAKGKVATVSGSITASWKRTRANHFNLNLTVPPGTTANVYLPAINQESITVNGQPLSKSLDHNIHQEDNKGYVLKVGSGSYEFGCQMKD